MKKYKPYNLVVQRPGCDPKHERSTALFADACELGQDHLLFRGASRAWIRTIGYDDDGFIRSQEWEARIQDREVVWRALGERMGV